MRFAQGFRVMAVQKRDHLSMQLVGGAAVIFEIAHQRRHVGARLGDGLAIVAGFQTRQRLGLGLDAQAQAQHQPAALGRSQPAPIARQRGAGGGDGRVHILGAGFGDRRKGHPVDGRDHRHLASRCGRQPGAADQVQGAGQVQRRFHLRLVSPGFVPLSVTRTGP
jgi:hypothetical protein